MKKIIILVVCLLSCVKVSLAYTLEESGKYKDNLEKSLYTKNNSLVKLNIKENYKFIDERIGDVSKNVYYELYKDGELFLTITDLNDIYIPSNSSYVLKDMCLSSGATNDFDNEFTVAEDDYTVVVNKSILYEKVTFNINNDRDYYVTLDRNKEVYEVVNKNYNEVILPFGLYFVSNKNDTYHKNFNIISEEHLNIDIDDSTNDEVIVEEPIPPLDDKKDEEGFVPPKVDEGKDEDKKEELKPPVINNDKDEKEESKPLVNNNDKDEKEESKPLVNNNDKVEKEEYNNIKENIVVNNNENNDNNDKLELLDNDLENISKEEFTSNINNINEDIPLSPKTKDNIIIYTLEFIVSMCLLLFLFRKNIKNN